MRWRTGRRSQNVEDRRGRSGFGGSGQRRMGGGLLSLLPLLLKLGLGRRGIVIVLLIGAVIWFSGGNLGGLLGNITGMQPGMMPGEEGLEPAQRNPEDDETGEFVKAVLAFTEDTWRPLFQQLGRQYEEPKLVMFSGAIASACGLGQAAMGPFYCPADQKVYIDLSFFEDLHNRFRAPGDFAQAYVIAHEIGHHVQTLLGISNKVRKAQQAVGQSESNRLSVQQELQADCLAGVWAKNADMASDILEQGDIEEALTAASAIGDDRLQRQSQGHVVPDSFTHGSSEQRMRWFKTGLKSGRLQDCDTFSAATL